MASSLRSLRLLQNSLRSSSRAFHSSVRRAEQFVDADPHIFHKAISSKEKIVLVDFYANWCGPCKVLSPILEKLAEDASVKTGSGKSIDLVTIDTDQHGTLAAQFKVRALPTVVAFHDGKAVDQFVGALNETGVRQFIAKV